MLDQLGLEGLTTANIAELALTGVIGYVLGRLVASKRLKKDNADDVKYMYEAVIAARRDGDIDADEATELYEEVESHASHRIIKWLAKIF